MERKTVSSSEDERIKKNKIESLNVSSEKEGELIINSEEQFQPEYNEEPFLNDGELHNQIDDNGDIEFVESVEDFSRFESGVDQDFIIDESEEIEDEEELLEEFIYNKSTPSDGDAYLIIIEEDDQVLDKIIFVHELSEKDILFKDEDERHVMRRE